MLDKIYNFSFPVGGGTLGAITKVPEVTSSTITHSGIVLETILVAAIGALTGYIVKKLLDYIWPKFCRLCKK